MLKFYHVLRGRASTLSTLYDKKNMINSKLPRNALGKFTLKGDEPRVVRSIRLTPKTWATLGEIASERGITRVDLIENLVATGVQNQESGVDLSTNRSQILVEIEQAMNSILDDPKVTRKGKDSGAVKRAFQALQKALQ